MDLEPIVVWAEILMLTADQGGRSKPLVGGSQYRPNHNFWPEGGEPEQFAIGLVDVPLGADRQLGEPFETRIKFLVWPELRPELKPGRSWRIQEANRIVGYGKISRIIEE